MNRPSRTWLSAGLALGTIGLAVACLAGRIDVAWVIVALALTIAIPVGVRHR